MDAVKTHFIEKDSKFTCIDCIGFIFILFGNRKEFSNIFTSKWKHLKTCYPYLWAKLLFFLIHNIHYSAKHLVSNFHQSMHFYTQNVPKAKNVNRRVCKKCWALCLGLILNWWWHFFCKYVSVSKIFGIVWGINSIWLCFEAFANVGRYKCTNHCVWDWFYQTVFSNIW